MVNLTVAFVAGIGMGVFLEVLAWNVPSPAKQQLVVFIVVMAVLLVRVGALRKGARTGERSTWQHGAATTMRARSTSCAAGSRRRGSGWSWWWRSCCPSSSRSATTSCSARSASMPSSPCR